ncbi:MAG: DUF1059 domain-containing protein [Flavobacteriaceae bacterium]|nr:DUF1059 domain-containing protein [Flavobacteriaceae bacterium]
MKTMTCNQLGGTCDLEFKANTFEEMKQLSQQHGMEMFQKNDAAHLEAMNKMRTLMQSADSDAMQQWMDEKRAMFDGLPDSE